MASTNWPPAKAKWLESEATRNFRKAYTKYRQGRCKGAKGELLIVCGNQIRGVSKTDATTIKEISIFQDVEDDPQTIKVAQQLELYRRAYRQFRIGASSGAEGELSVFANKLSVDHLRLLPVAALARCLADQVKGSFPVPEPKLHTHFGAGKLGLGLLLPAMVKSEIPFVILQQISDCWSSTMDPEVKKVTFRINGQNICTLTVIRNFEELLATGYLHQINGDYRLRPPPGHSPDVENCRLLVLCDSLHRIIVLSTDSFSCALGSAISSIAQELVEILPANSGLDRPVLYACENDHKAVDSIRDLLDAPLYVKECLVDRICSDRVINGPLVDITTEPYEGDIVVTARFPNSISPAFGGTHVLKPTTPGAYAYLYQRKFLLVNGTHTTLAFMTLRELCTEPSEAPGDYELLSPETIPAEAMDELRAWSTARCLVLLHSHEVDVIKFAQGATTDDEVIDELWKYAVRTTKRFTTVKDSTKRVLGGGVANRYETRLKDVLDTIETFDRIPLGYKMLNKASFRSMDELKTILRKLVQDAEIFVHPDAYKQGSLGRRSTG